MVTGPDRLEIHIHVSWPPPRAGPSLGALILLVVFWPWVLAGWAIWFLVTLLLTFAGLVLAAAVALGSMVAPAFGARPAPSRPGLSRAHRLGNPATTTQSAEDQREAAIASLRRAYACGEIELSEFEERAGWALRFDPAGWPAPTRVDPVNGQCRRAAPTVRPSSRRFKFCHGRLVCRP
jgi:hypothetical protein